MAYELVPERIKWHMNLIESLQTKEQSLDDANKLMIQTMANWFGELKHEVSSSGLVHFDSRITDFSLINPRLNITILNNKVIFMLRKIESVSKDDLEEQIYLHFEDLKRIFAELVDNSGEIFGWTYGINPRLSKLYRLYKS